MKSSVLVTYGLNKNNVWNGHCIVVLNDGKYSKAILKIKDKLTNKDSSSYSRFKDIYYA